MIISCRVAMMGEDERDNRDNQCKGEGVDDKPDERSQRDRRGRDRDSGVPPDDISHVAELGYD